MRMRFLVAALATAAVTPASAATVILTFDNAAQPGAVQACTGADGGLTDRLCNHNSFVGVDYGTTAQLGVSYNAGGTDTSLRAYDSGFYRGGAYNLGAGNLFSDIVFTPAAGYEVSLKSWNYAKGSATHVDYFFEVRDSANNLVASHTAGANGSFTANTAYFTGPLTFRFRNEGGGAVIDNVELDVRGLAQGGVPEPTSWALMLSGFGFVGSAMRRRSAKTVLA